MHRLVRTTLFAASLIVLLPATVLGHSEYESSDPADGAVLAAQPDQITATFSERTRPKQSSLRLKSPNGDIIATGGVPAGGPPTRMVIDAIPELEPGVYTVLWTTVALDGDGLKGSFTFTLEASESAAPGAESSPSAEPAASPSATPAPTASPTAPPTTAPTATPVPSATSPAPATPTSPAATPAAGTGGDASATSGSGSGLGLLAVALAVVVVIAVGAWIYRRRNA